MFGYVTVNQPELKIREYEWYHSFYCGLCGELQKAYGIPGQLSLTYDATFLVILLTGLYEPETPCREVRCIPHPLSKHQSRTNEFTAYAADMNVLLAYFQCVDDWKDERNIPKGAMSAALKGAFRKAEAKHPAKAELIADRLRQLEICEKEGDPDIDRASGLFGQITAEMFAVREDNWTEELRRIGFYLGKFIYLMDAYEDLEKDEKSGNYNPFLIRIRKGASVEDCEEYLNMMMAECCRSFERLPILTGVEILRNILYSGVWTRFGITTLRRKEKEQHGRSV